MPWECNVTPVHGGCQEGNTICCVSSNDGLDAGLRSFFPQWPGVWGHWKFWVASLAGAGMPEGLRRPPGLKPRVSFIGYAALKRRSSTVVSVVQCESDGQQESRFLPSVGMTRSGVGIGIWSWHWDLELALGSRFDATVHIRPMRGLATRQDCGSLRRTRAAFSKPMIAGSSAIAMGT